MFGRGGGRNNDVLASTFKIIFSCLSVCLFVPLSLPACPTVPLACSTVSQRQLQLLHSITLDSCLGICLSVCGETVSACSCFSFLPLHSLLSPSPSLLMCLTIKRSDSAFDSLLCVANICFSLHHTHCLFPSLTLYSSLSLSLCNLVFLKHTKRTSCCI